MRKDGPENYREAVSFILQVSQISISHMNAELWGSAILAVPTSAMLGTFSLLV